MLMLFIAPGLQMQIIDGVTYINENVTDPESQGGYPCLHYEELLTCHEWKKENRTVTITECV